MTPLLAYSPLEIITNQNDTHRTRRITSPLQMRCRINCTQLLMNFQQLPLQLLHCCNVASILCFTQNILFFYIQLYQSCPFEPSSALDSEFYLSCPISSSTGLKTFSRPNN